MIKNISIFLFVSILLTGCWLIDQDEPEIRAASGIVTYLSLEGGFWGILGDNEQNYDPLNLHEEYKIEDLHISFLYKVSDQQNSFHMWGTIIEILTVTVIE